MKYKIFLTVTTLAVFSLGVSFFSGQAQAANAHHVSPDGSGTLCSETDPCSFFSAQLKATQGDTIKFTAGTYNDSYTFDKPGIIYEGALDAQGNRLSIISPYVSIKGSGNNWVEQTGSPSRYWKRNIGWQASEMVIKIDGEYYKLPHICVPQDDSRCDTTGSFNYLQAIGQWTYDDSYDPNNGSAFDLPRAYNRWGGIGIITTVLSNYDALVDFQYDTDDPGYNATYDNPNNLDIYASMAGDNTILVTASNSTVKNFIIYAKRNGIYLDKVSYTTIDNNKIILGGIKVNSEASDYSDIKNNEYTDFYYYDEYLKSVRPHSELVLTRGAWETNVADANVTDNALYSQWRYVFHKFRSNWDNGHRASMGVFFNSSDNNTQTNDYAHEIGGLSNSLSSTENSVSYSTLRNSESIGITGIPSSGTFSIHNNVFENINNVIRIHPWNSNTNGILYFYNNKSWLPINYGNHLYFHYLSSPLTLTNIPTLWAYHNSFSGGRAGILVHDLAGSCSPTSGLGEVYLVNNITATEKAIQFRGATTNGGIGICSYNWIAGLCAWCGSPWPCYNNSANYYPNNNNTTFPPGWTGSTIHSFTPPTQAVGKGIDISKTFTINGTQHSALPGFSSGYYTGYAPDMGWINSASGDTTPPAAPQGVSVQ